MRILQIINSLDTGGAEKLLLEAIPKYLEADIDMELLVLRGGNQPFLKALQANPNVNILSLGNGSVYNPFHVFKIIKYLRSFDLIHVHLFPALYWVAIAKMISFSKTPLFFTEHNTSNQRRGSFVFRFIDKLIYINYIKIITISEEVDRLVKAHLNFKSSRFVLIRNGVDLEKIGKSPSADRNEFNFEAKDKIVIQVSSFTKQKDQNTLIKAIKYLKTSVKLVLVGNGELINESKQLVKDLNLEDKVLFLGIRMDVPALLKMANVIVLSSHYEGLSLSSIEALASGRPFVASDAPGLSKLINGAGVLFPVGDEQSLAHVLEKLLNDRIYEEKIVNQCIERSQHYGLQKMIEKHIKLYSEVCPNQN